MAEEQLSEWHRRWNDEMVGGWTRKVLPDLRQWFLCLRKMQPSYHISQVLTVHRCFQVYLKFRWRARSPIYLWCLNTLETVEYMYTIFKCANNSVEWDELEAKLDRTIEPENVRFIQYNDTTMDLIVNKTPETWESNFKESLPVYDIKHGPIKRDGRAAETMQRAAKPARRGGGRRRRMADHQLPPKPST